VKSLSDPTFALRPRLGLVFLWLFDNPDLTKAQIAALKRALPKCRITHNAMR
jgi:hypothetical protein